MKENDPEFLQKNLEARAKAMEADMVMSVTEENGYQEITIITNWMTK